MKRDIFSNPTINTLAGTAVLVALFIFLVQPTAKSVRDARSAVQQGRIRVQLASVTRSDAAVNERETAKLQPSIASIKTFYLTAETAIDFVATFEKLAQQNHVTGDLVGLRAPGPGQQQTDFTISASGAYSDLVHYLHQIEQLPQYVQILSIHITSGEANLPTRVMTLSARIFWQ